ncbi:hypothetical protein N1851_026504 [Merluccius polli]|uniref:Uncharacterized protein n=1 Tax=Merluccius polli TaxID=89951 RepID=A0AA47NTZ4_MERPO|nr:hypothetical protein N1851_026504 [Merluccius polli]
MTVSPQKGAFPIQRTGPGVCPAPRSSTGLSYSETTAPTGPWGRPGSDQAAGPRRCVGEETARARGAARWPCGPSGHSGGHEKAARHLGRCSQGGQANEGVFKAPQTAWRSLFSALSSRPDKEREGRPSRELGGAAAVSSGHIQDLLDKGKAFSTGKVFDSASSYRPIELLAFHSPPFSSREQERLNALCPAKHLFLAPGKEGGLERERGGKTPPRRRVGPEGAQALDSSSVVERGVRYTGAGSQTVQGSAGERFVRQAGGEWPQLLHFSQVSLLVPSELHIWAGFL